MVLREKLYAISVYVPILLTPVSGNLYSTNGRMMYINAKIQKTKLGNGRWWGVGVNEGQTGPIEFKGTGRRPQASPPRKHL